MNYQSVLVLSNHPFIHLSRSSVEAEAEAILDVFKMYDAVKEDDPKVTKEQ
jgi:hypothetical protein